MEYSLTDGVLEAESTDALERALEKCQETASRGYSIARKHLEESAAAIENATLALKSCLDSVQSNQIRTHSIVIQLQNQLNGIVNDLEHVQRETESHLEERRKRLARFSITLFGRTLAGKSTLMEILTKGDGSSIGKGGQRTTRDVRPYVWRGMEVTDVPGVAAFEGKEDEEVAYQAAQQADMVLFLITDDAPQPIEAECLANIRRLGKPVLGVCNVKVSVDEEVDLAIFLRNPNRPFDIERIRPLINQFNTFTDQFMPGKKVPFVPVHLRSRFLADKVQYKDISSKLKEASRFHQIEHFITKEVIGKGAFFRTKSFIDGVLTPMLNMTDMMLEFSAQNSASGRVLVGKRRQFYNWAQDFKTSGQERIEMLVSKICSGLRDDVAIFAEEHFEDRKAGEKWNNHIKATGINEKIANLQKGLYDECIVELMEIAREIKTELSLVMEFAGNRSISMTNIVDSKRMWNWGTTLISGGLGIAAIVLASGPIGWAAAGVGIIGWLISFALDSREEKTQRARKKLSDKLNDNIDRIERDLRKQLQNWFYNELIKRQIYVLLADLKSVTECLFELADAQRSLAWTLNKCQGELEMILLDEALGYLNVENFMDQIHGAARIPGFAIMLKIAPDITFPNDVRFEMERLFGERIWFVIDNGNLKSILSQAIGRGCKRELIGIENDLSIAHIPLDDLDVMTRTRVKLAQQLTGLHIVR